MKLHFQKLGNGKPIVILHGFLGTSDNWITVGRKLSKEYSVYLVDQRNHGQSPHSDDFNYDLLADDLHELLEEEGIHEPILIGHSMGGKTVMRYSVKYPDSFSMLVVVDIAPRAYPVHHQTILDGLLSIDLKSLSSREEADDQLSKFISEPGIRQFLLKNLSRSKDGFEWKANLPILNQKIENVGEKISGESVTENPVYFIAGEKSDYIQSTDREDIKKLYPNAKTLSIKDAGHWVHAEQRDAFLKTLNHLIKNVNES